ncbi:MAG: hypothetical protein AAF550_08120 [Myxococcota bacterium]
MEAERDALDPKAHWSLNAQRVRQVASALRMSFFVQSALLWLSVAGCSEQTHEIALDLVTDLAPQVDSANGYLQAQVDHITGNSEPQFTSPPENALTSLSGNETYSYRIAAFEKIPRGRHRFEVALVNAQEDQLVTVLARPVLVDIRRNTVVRVFLTQDCVGVACDDPDNQFCRAGECVPLEVCSSNSRSCESAPEPRPEPEPEPVPECVRDSDCPVPETSCAEALCEAGRCGSRLVQELCSAPLTCVENVGCALECSGDADCVCGTCSAGLCVPPTPGEDSCASPESCMPGFGCLPLLPAFDCPTRLSIADTGDDEWSPSLTILQGTDVEVLGFLSDEGGTPEYRFIYRTSDSDWIGPLSTEAASQVTAGSTLPKPVVLDDIHLYSILDRVGFSNTWHGLAYVTLRSESSGATTLREYVVELDGDAIELNFAATQEAPIEGGADADVIDANDHFSMTIRSGSGDRDIAFSAPELYPSQGINSDFDEISPSPTPSLQALVFASNRASHDVQEFRLFVGYRDGDRFDLVLPMSSLDDPQANTVDAWLRSDLQGSDFPDIFFASNRGPDGDLDLYTADADPNVAPATLSNRCTQ